MKQHFIGLLIAVFAAGCGTTRTCTTAPSPDDLTQFEFSADQFSKSVQDRSSVKQPTEAYHVLILSGGGANGAWGAGFLNGWSSHNRPKFDTVTGVSTGSLIATAAFIGDDAMLEQAYTTTATADIQASRFFITLPFSDSLDTNGGLQKLLKKYLSNEVIDKVAAGSLENRCLYVGLTNLDTGKLEIVDLTRIAAAKDYDLYRRVALASSSAPPLYPPVQIGNSIYVDGGVRASLFFRKHMVPKLKTVREKQKARALAPGAESAKPSVYVIVNGKFGMPPQCTVDGLLPVAMRSVSCLLDANGIGDLYQTKLFAADLHYNLNVSYIPDEVPAVPSFEFVPKDMKALFEEGKKRGAAGTFFDIPEPD